MNGFIRFPFSSDPDTGLGWVGQVPSPGNFSGSESVSLKHSLTTYYVPAQSWEPPEVSEMNRACSRGWGFILASHSESSQIQTAKPTLHYILGLVLMGQWMVLEHLGYSMKLALPRETERAGKGCCNNLGKG